MSDVDSIKQRQEEEFGVLESIYGKEIADLRKQHSKEWQPLHISISLTPSQGGSNYQVYTKLDFHVICSNRYPDEKPRFEFKNIRGLSKVELSQLQGELDELSEECKGEVMIFQLSNHITHFLHKHNKPKPEVISFYDQMVLRKMQEEDNNRIILAKERDREKQVLLAEIQRRDELLNCSEEKDDDTDSDSSTDDNTNTNSFKKRNSSIHEEFVENCSCNSEAASIIEFSNTREYRVVHRGRCLAHSNSECTAFNSVDNKTCELLVMYQWSIPTEVFADSSAVQRQLSGMEQEFNYLVKLNHPNLAHYVNLNWSMDDQRLQVQLLREYIYGLNCKELYVSKGIPIDVEMLRCVANDVLTALDYLHRHNVVHKKICDSCIYITKRNVKLVNFSLYRRYSDITLLSQASSSATKKTTDVYRFGMVLISLLKGVEVDEHCDIPSNASTELYDFLNRCICKDEKQRYTAHQLLEHPFITQPRERCVQTPEEGPEDTGAPAEQLELLQSYYRNNGNGPSRVATEFEVLHYLGKGAFGAVIKVRNKIDQRYYAIKRIQLNPKNRQENRKIFQEVKTLSRLNHEHVVRYFNSWIETDVRQDGDSGTATTDASVVSPEPYRRDLEFTMDDRNIERDAPPPVQDVKDWSISMKGKLKSGLSESDDSDSLSRSDTLDDSDDIVFERDSNAEDVDEPEDTDTVDSVRPHVCQIQYLYIQMEFCEKSTLRTAIDDGLYKDKERIWRLLTEVVDGLIYIHKKGMIHRDLKPVNIFLNKNDNVKIGDFGLATTKLLLQTGGTSSLHSSQIADASGAGDQPLTGNVGTALYVAPEVEKVEKDGKTLYNQKVDTYSLGIIFFEMCYKPMMTRMERYNILKELRKPDILFPDDFLNRSSGKSSEVSKEERIIRLLLNHDYNKRPSAQTLKNDYLPKPTLEASRIEQLVNTTLSKPNSKLYNQLISACLNQSMTCSEDIMYDHDAEASMPPTYKYLKLYDFTRKVMIKVFKLHGGQNLPTPLLMPKNKFYDHVNSYVKLMTQWGSVVSLPHDLRVPFARFLAWNEITFLRRFSVERVYRERKPTRYKDHGYKHMPRELYECAFDIVAPTPGRFTAEAELLYIFKQIIDSLPGLGNEMFTIRLNHSLLVKAILRYCGINENFAEISNILSGLKDGTIAKTQVQTHLSSFGLSDKEIAAIFQLIEPEIPIDKIDSNFQMLVKTKINPNCSAFAKQALKELKHVISAIHGFDIGMKVVITPNLLYNIQQYSGVMFQIVVLLKKGKGFVNHVVAAGGRYDAMVTYYRTVLERANLRSHDLSQSAAGISISLDKLVLALRMDQSRIDADERYKKSNVDAVVLYTETDAGTEWKSNVMTQLWSAGIKSYLVEKSQEDLLGENCVPYKIILSDTERGIGKLEGDNNSMDNRDRSISDIIDMIGLQKGYNISRSDSRTVSERAEHQGVDISYHFLPSDKQLFRLKKTDIQKHLDGVLKKLTGEIAIFTFSVQEELLRIMAAYLEVESEESLMNSQELVVEIFRPGKQKKHVSEASAIMGEICSLMGDVRAVKKKATFVVYSLCDGVYKVFL